MLIGLSPCLDGDVLKILSDMGHGDEVLIADANFPAERCAQRLVRNMGCDSVQMLSAVLTVFPLDHLVPPVWLMALAEGDSGMGEPSIWVEYRQALALHGYYRGFNWHKYEAFYQAANNCFAVIQTGETALYGNIILRKGAIKPS